MVSAPCVVENLQLKDDGYDIDWSAQSTRHIIMDASETEWATSESPIDMQRSPIKNASGWQIAPQDAKEIVILCSEGLVRYPALLLKNEDGDYDKVAVFKNKKSTEPLVVLEKGKLQSGILSEAIKDDVKYDVSRNMKLLTIEPDGSKLTIYVSSAVDINNDNFFHPRRLHRELAENVGYITPTSYVGCQDPTLISDCMLDNWNVSMEWQAASIQHLIKTENVDVVFSHFHNIDLQMHKVVKHLADQPFNRLPHEAYEKFVEDIYMQTDRYLGKFYHLLDEGWTIVIISDHGLISPAHELPLLNEYNGVSAGLMKDLGYTVLKKDEQGNEIAEIDWDKTTAVAVRECNIYLNLKGRESHGIVDPEEQYELEEKIMTDLYSLRSPKTGHRYVSVALRNRDAVLLGYGGPDCGDICYFMAEGYNDDHQDCLSTTLGEGDTSVSPIFIACGKGFKRNFRTERIIREADVAPTVAVLGGVRMPAQCEGAPAYQIFDGLYE